MISLIAALAVDRVIGMENAMPWNLPAFLPLVYTLTMFWLVRRGWSPLRLIAVTEIGRASCRERV